MRNIALCVSSLLCLGDCSGDVEETATVNVARFTVNSATPATYQLDEMTILDTSISHYPKLQWLGKMPTTLFEAQMPIREGSNTAESIRFRYALPDPGSDDASGLEMNCSGTCSGTYTGKIDYTKRKLIIDIDMSFIAEIANCPTRHKININTTDLSTEYPVCEGICDSLFLGCCCRQALPCSGSVAQNGEQLCPNPDFRKDKVKIGLTANAELTEDMLALP